MGLDIVHDVFAEASFLDRSTAGQSPAVPVMFREAARCYHAGDIGGAQRLLHATAESPDIRSYYQLVAWNGLRTTGFDASRECENVVLGVVVEASLVAGIDVLAAYADMTCRYFNHTGAAVIWEHPNISIDDAIGAVILEAQRTLRGVGVWRGPRRPPPRPGSARLNILSNFGLYFGEGTFELLGRDLLSRDLLARSMNLLQNVSRLPRHA